MYKTKVAMVTGEFLPHIGGVEIHIDKICRELKYAVDITVICAAQGNIELPYKVIRNYDLNNHQYLEDNFDIIHFHDFSHVRQCRKPWYVTFHGYEGHVPPDVNVISQRQAISKLACGTMHVGNYLHKWYGTHNPNDITIVGGCHGHLLSPKQHRTYKAGYVGRISEDKRTDIYLKAETILQNTFMPQFKLEIAEKLDNSKIDEFWADKDYAFCNGQLSMLEAMSCGVPVIPLASNAMVYDMLKDFDLDVAVNEYDIASSVNKINYKYGIERISQHSYSQMHTWDKVAKKYIELWRVQQ